MNTAATASSAPPPEGISECIVRHAPEMWARWAPWYGSAHGSFRGAVKPAPQRLSLLCSVVVHSILASMNPAWGAELKLHDDGTPRALVFSSGEEEARVSVRMDDRYLSVRGYDRISLSARNAGKQAIAIIAEAAQAALDPLPPHPAKREAR